jgi:hydrogenase maturation protease
MMERRQVVLGIGNILNSDEGLGVHAVRMLEQALRGRTDVEFIDGGTLGLNLLDLVEECTHLLVLDAANAGISPGSLIALKRDEIPLFTGIKMSQHQATFQEVLGLASIRDRLPVHLHFIGIQPEVLDIGMELSQTVKTMLPTMISAAAGILEEWGLVHEHSDIVHS